MNSSLFADFDPTTFSQWKAQATKDLKGKNFDETLVWQTPEGFEVQPYYTDEDLQRADSKEIEAAQMRPNAGWFNLQTIVFESESLTNARLIGLLTKGVDGFILDLSQHDVRSIVLPKLLHGIKLSDTPIHFKVNNQSAELLRGLQVFINYQMRGGIQDDAHAAWAQTGFSDPNFYKNLKETIINTKSSPIFRPVTVESHIYHHAGATAVQELACVLASGVAYVDKLTDLGMTPADIFSKIQFSVSVGTSYFMEIAKLRALRYLWRNVMKQYQVPDYQNQVVFIIAHTSHFFDATTAPHTNLLRATTEAMAAVMGNADALAVHGFDADFEPNNLFSERIARNLSVLMKEESHFDKINDPAAGSYYIETLTEQLAQNAWKLFLEVEAKGGFVAAFEQNFLQNLIETAYDAKREALQSGKTVMVGVNKFQVSGQPKPERILPKIKTQAVAFKLLTEKRIADAVA